MRGYTVKASKTVLFVLLLGLLSSSLFAEICVFVNRDLYPSISTAVYDYITTLQSQGYSVCVDFVTYNDDASHYVSLRNTLRDRWLNHGLEGAIFIGNLAIVCSEESDASGNKNTA